jgi:hypothetical protein
MGELGPEVEAELAVLRKRMRRALKGGDMALYARVKAEYVDRVHQEQRRAQRAARDAQRARQEAPVRPGRVPWSRWRHGRSPGAVARDRQPAPVEPQRPPASGHLSPWRRRGGTASEVCGGGEPAPGRISGSGLRVARPLGGPQQTRNEAVLPPRSGEWAQKGTGTRRLHFSVRPVGQPPFRLTNRKDLAFGVSTLRP